MNDFTQEQNERWDKHLRDECEMLMDSLTLTDLPGAIKAAGLRPDQLFGMCDLVPFASKLADGLLNNRDKRVQELVAEITSAVTNLLDAARLSPEEVFDDDALEEWATGKEYVRPEPKP